MGREMTSKVDSLRRGNEILCYTVKNVL